MKPQPRASAYRGEIYFVTPNTHLSGRNLTVFKTQAPRMGRVGQGTERQQMDKSLGICSAQTLLRFSGPRPSFCPMCEVQHGEGRWFGFTPLPLVVRWRLRPPARRWQSQAPVPAGVALSLRTFTSDLARPLPSESLWSGLGSVTLSLDPRRRGALGKSAEIICRGSTFFH